MQTKTLQQLIKMGSQTPDVYVLTSGEAGEIANFSNTLSLKADLVSGKVPLSQLPEELPGGYTEFIIDDIEE